MQFQHSSTDSPRFIQDATAATPVPMGTVAHCVVQEVTEEQCLQDALWHLEEALWSFGLAGRYHGKRCPDSMGHRHQ